MRRRIHVCARRSALCVKHEGGGEREREKRRIHVTCARRKALSVKQWWSKQNPNPNTTNRYFKLLVDPKI